MSNLINLKDLLDIFNYLVRYIPMTIGLTFGSMFLASLLGLFVMIVRSKKIPVLSQLAWLYVVLGRALPSMIIIYIVFFGIPVLFMYIMGGDGANAYLSSLAPAYYAILGLTIHTGAYLAEIFRGAVQSVSYVQTEAGLSIGMTWSQVFFRIVLPQAAVYATPLLANQFLNLLKGTSIAFMISVVEIFGAASVMASDTNQYLEIYLVTALIYWGISICFEKTFEYLEFALSYYKRGN